MSRPGIICLTPVRNEAWILERFLASASVWADHIIVADQRSNDGSRDIASRFPKVRLIENDSETFNEPERQKLLVNEARKIPGENLWLALDADEFLPANFARTLDWKLILRAVPGTVIQFQWACVMPDRKSYYVFPTWFPLGVIDDGTEHRGRPIHSPRIPIREDGPRISAEGIKVLHLSTTDFERFKSKVRWYQCWEFLQGRWDGRLINLYRWYHRDFHIPQEKIRPLPEEWVEGCGTNVDLPTLPTYPFYQWDEALIDMFLEHGPEKFRRIAVWDVDWNAMHRKIHGVEPPRDLGDPRSAVDRLIHRWLERTQPHHAHFPTRPTRGDRYLDRGVRMVASRLGW